MTSAEKLDGVGVVVVWFIFFAKKPNKQQKLGDLVEKERKK